MDIRDAEGNRAGCRSASSALLLLLALAITGCSFFNTKVEPPPRSDQPIAVPDGHSTFAADVDISLRELRQALEAEVPRRLWSIDQPNVECVPPKRRSIIGISIKTPTIRCDLAGQVTRGRLALSGAGRDLIVTMPIKAEIAASDIGGVVKKETATAEATVTARVRPTLQSDWRVTGNVTISYSWQQPPTVTVLGQDVTFANQADERLKGVVRSLERTIEREIAKLNVRRKITPLWQRSFAVLSLNREKPPVWLRLTPRQVWFDGYTASRRRLSLQVRLDAQTEIVVGEKPAVSAADPLPDIQTSPEGEQGLSLILPVVAQYSQLEPVLKRALEQRFQEPFDVPKIGERIVELRSVTIYGTDNNRIAVGVEFEAWAPGKRDDPAVGTVWLTALPHNAPNSRVVEFTQVEYQAETSRFTTNVLLEIAKTQDFSDTIEQALTQNFENDYKNLLEKVESALARQNLGRFTVQTKLNTVSTGTIMAYGEGLYLPVSADGEAQIQLAPR